MPIKIRSHSGIVPGKIPPIHRLDEGKQSSCCKQAIKILVPNQPCNTSTSLCEASETAKSLYKQVNPIFEKVTGHSLVKELTKVKDLNIEERASKAEKRKTRRNNYMKFKQAVEKEWEDTSFIRYIYP